jgi:hypothetical protein
MKGVIILPNTITRSLYLYPDSRAVPFGNKLLANRIHLATIKSNHYKNEHQGFIPHVESS